MSTAAPSTFQALSTPEPTKATVFNVAEYKKQMAAKQQQKTQQAVPAKSTATAAAAKAPASSSASTKPAAAAAPAKAAAAAAAPSADDAAVVVDLNNVGAPLMKVEARYDFKGDASKDEMSFEKGDYITVYGRSKVDGWWAGRKQGDKKVLLFPFNYVKFVKKFA